MSDVQVSVEIVQNFHCKFNQLPVSAALTAVIVCGVLFFHENMAKTVFMEMTRLARFEWAFWR